MALINLFEEIHNHGSFFGWLVAAVDIRSDLLQNATLVGQSLENTHTPSSTAYIQDARTRHPCTKYVGIYLNWPWNSWKTGCGTWQESSNGARQNWLALFSCMCPAAHTPL
jgi:hypothetical protein